MEDSDEGRGRMTQTRGRGEACGGDGMTRMTRMSDADGPDASTRSESRHGGRGPRTGDSESGRGRQVWDLRRLKTAVAAFGGLDNFFDTTAAVFGPGDESPPARRSGGPATGRPRCARRSFALNGVN